MQNEGFKKRAPKFFIWGVFLFVALVAADQLSKKYASNIFHNSQFAFSLPLPVWLIYLIYTAVVAWMVYYCAKNFRKFSFWESLGWVLIFSGAVSNITERIFLGYVKDFIYITFYKWTGVYNLADFFIIAGILLLVFKAKKSG